jgi:PTS system nitrogen regulatory IIA component
MSLQPPLKGPEHPSGLPQGTMKILDFLDPSAITLDLKSQKKPEIVAELCQLLAKAQKTKNPAAVARVIMERETLGSTGIGQGIAIPHGKSEAVNSLAAAVGISKKGVDFEALDGESVHIVFLLIAPKDTAADHLKALARISRLLKDKFVRTALQEAKTPQEVIKTIQEDDAY